MNSRVRIIKRGSDDDTNTLMLGRDEKTARQSEREIVSTVKGWVTEWGERRRLDGLRAFALIK